jgi:hypothetical protein
MSNEIDRGKPKYSGKNLSQCHFVHHKSYPGSNPGLRGGRPATNRLSHGTAFYSNSYFSAELLTAVCDYEDCSLMGCGAV